jgi:surfeit locus 1 family protein
VIAAACVGLGLWQLRRLADRRALNAEILEMRAAPALAVGSAEDIAALSPFRRVIVDGTYDLEGEVLLYGRSFRGEPGHLVVTPLALDDGSGVLVVRGWVPFSMADRAPVTEAPPIARDVRVEGWLVAPETTGESRPDARGVVRTLDIAGIGTRLPYELAPFAIQLQDQARPPPPFPVQVPLPELSEGPHLSYAIQWFSFAAIALVGAAVLIRRDRRATATP